MNAFMTIKMKASGYPVGYTTQHEKTTYIECVRAHEEISLSHDDIVYNAERHTVAKQHMRKVCTKLRQVHDIVCDRTA